MRCKRSCFLLLLLATLYNSVLYAGIQLPHIFGDHMVLQRDQPIPVWGTANAGEQITVTLADSSTTTIADQDGHWSTTLPAQKAGGPYTLTVTGTNTVTYSDVLIGEVWLCSGQSNMEWLVGNSDNAEQEQASANHPLIRHIKIPKRPDGFPQDDIEATWTICSPDTVGSYTAVGYFFGRNLLQELDVPIGLVNSSWGGTRIEPWTPPCGLAAVPPLADISQKVQLTDPTDAVYRQRLEAYLQSLGSWMENAQTSLREHSPLEPAPAYPQELKPLTGHQDPTTLYNGMIHPLVPYGIRGAIWYQGESNHAEGMLYFEKMKALIQGWREVWDNPSMPFYYVQIAPYQYGDESPTILPRFWEAQAKALEIPGTGMAVIHDIGDLNDIHPRNKQDVGKRLALIALAKTYGQEDVVYSGPAFKSLSLEGNKLRVTFEDIGSGLQSRDGKSLDSFEIIGPGTDFTKAEAVIDGDSVVLSSPDVKKPVAVRFAWHKLAEPNLCNREGLPGVPFRAGTVPPRDWLQLQVPQAEQFQLVYDLNLDRLGRNIEYDVDNSHAIEGELDRIAYFVELASANDSTQYVFAAMDAFTQDVSLIGIPTVASGAHFQQPVENLTIISNLPSLTAGPNLPGGNIEFWPNNYGPGNGMKVPNAKDNLFDFGDDPGAPVDGYGCMQVHNHAAQQTVFAINQWKAGAQADIGIGNSTGETHDWTFTRNADAYKVKRLRVLVRTE